MTSARDEAIQAVADAAHKWRYGETAAAIADNELCILSEAIVDAIPPNVLVGLAIERGGLVVTRGELASVLMTPLYRVVEP